MCVYSSLFMDHSEFTQDQRDEPPEECRLQSQKMTGKREIEREREVWCKKTKAGGEDRGKRKDRG